MSGNFRFSSLAKLKIGPYRRRGPKIRPKHLQNTCAMHSFQFQCLDFLKEIIYCLLKMSSIWVLLRKIYSNPNIYDSHEHLKNLFRIVYLYFLLHFSGFPRACIILIIVMHCGMRDKSSLFLSAVFKNMIFLCSF